MRRDWPSGVTVPVEVGAKRKEAEASLQVPVYVKDEPHVHFPSGHVFQCELFRRTLVK